MSESTTETTTTETKAGGKPTEGALTQADVDAAVEKIAAKIRADEREKVSKKYADYDELKKKAEGSATAEEKLAKLQADLEETQREALKRRVQAAHKISDEDADLFLTGSDEESLTAQAKRLAEREAARTTKGNRVPGEGRTQTKPGDDPMRVFTREVFGREE
jgi:hypothetical protein